MGEVVEKKPLSEAQMIESSNYVSRDLSWVCFNHRVIDQVGKPSTTLGEWLRFLSISSRNSDEFFMVRVGSLYNYVDYNKPRTDYSGLELDEFKRLLLQTYQGFSREQVKCYVEKVLPALGSKGIYIRRYEDLPAEGKQACLAYFKHTIYPMLTPMVYDGMHTFPTLINQVLIYAVVSKELHSSGTKKVSFIQIPSNIARFYEWKQGKELVYVPVESIIGSQIQDFFKNVRIHSISLMRLTRNGDFTIEESEDIESNFLDELRVNLRQRRTGRVVRLELVSGYDRVLVGQLATRWSLEEENRVEVSADALLDFSALTQIGKCRRLQAERPPALPASSPLSMRLLSNKSLFEVLKERDVLLHHPYHSFYTLVELIEQAAKDPAVLSLKITLYRVAHESRVVEALLRAAEAGKHVVVLFELKARFDEERNMKQALRLQKAGCYVIYGLGKLKAHAKMLLIVREKKGTVVRYTHTSTGNYNEDTANGYGDVGLLSARKSYADDISEFFNAITGHSYPGKHKHLLTAPRELRNTLLQLIEKECVHARAGRKAAVVLKINSLQDKTLIDALYKASQAGVRVELIVRGICCLRPHRRGISDRICVRSIVGRYLEHARIYYFENTGRPKIYIGSSDVMVRSFDTRVEVLIEVIDKFLCKEIVWILHQNLRDNVNTYLMNEDGSYRVLHPTQDHPPCDIHTLFHQCVEKAGPKDPLSLLSRLEQAPAVV